MKKLFLLTFFVFGITKSPATESLEEALEEALEEDLKELREAHSEAQFIKRSKRASKLFEHCMAQQNGEGAEYKWVHGDDYKDYKRISSRSIYICECLVLQQLEQERILKEKIIVAARNNKAKKERLKVWEALRDEKKY